jgi:hypothetical protein
MRQTTLRSPSREEFCVDRRAELDGKSWALKCVFWRLCNSSDGCSDVSCWFKLSVRKSTAQVALLFVTPQTFVFLAAKDWFFETDACLL